MKIAIFHELHSGGARRSVIEFGKQFQKQHTVDLYYVDEKENEKDKAFFRRAYFFQFIPKKWIGHDWKTKLYKDTVELYKLYKFHKKIAREIDKRKYDVVFIEPSKLTQAPFILRFLKTKKVYYCQEPLRMVYEPLLAIKKDLSFFKYYYEKLNRFIRKQIDRSNLSHADVVIGNSKYTSNNIKKAYGITSLTSYMGVDTDVFKPVKKKKDIDILFVGSYDFADGYNLLESAKKYFKKLPVIKVLAAEKQWITSDSMMRDLYCRSKIILALAYNEPFGLIPLEAMSCGVPVVAVNDGGYKETVVDGVTGYLVERNAKQLASKLSELLGNEDLRKKMGSAARKHALMMWRWEKNSLKLQEYL